MPLFDLYGTARGSDDVTKKRVRKITAAIDSENFELAEKEATKLINKFPDFRPAYVYKAIACAEQGKATIESLVLPFFKLDRAVDKYVIKALEMYLPAHVDVLLDLYSNLYNISPSADCAEKVVMLAIQAFDYQKLWDFVLKAYKADPTTRAIELACITKLIEAELFLRNDERRQAITLTFAYRLLDKHLINNPPVETDNSWHKRLKVELLLRLINVVKGAELKKMVGFLNELGFELSPHIFDADYDINRGISDVAARLKENPTNTQHFKLLFDAGIRALAQANCNTNACNDVLQRITDILHSLKLMHDDKKTKKIYYGAIFEWLRLLIILTDDCPNSQLGVCVRACRGEPMKLIVEYFEHFGADNDFMTISAKLADVIGHQQQKEFVNIIAGQISIKVEDSLMPPNEYFDSIDKYAKYINWLHLATRYKIYNQPDQDYKKCLDFTKCLFQLYRRLLKRDNNFVLTSDNWLISHYGALSLHQLARNAAKHSQDPTLDLIQGLVAFAVVTSEFGPEGLVDADPKSRVSYLTVALTCTAAMQLRASSYVIWLSEQVRILRLHQYVELLNFQATPTFLVNCGRFHDAANRAIELLKYHGNAAQDLTRNVIESLNSGERHYDIIMSQYSGINKSLHSIGHVSHALLFTYLRMFACDRLDDNIAYMVKIPRPDSYTTMLMRMKRTLPTGPIIDMFFNVDSIVDATTAELVTKRSNAVESRQLITDTREILTSALVKVDKPPLFRSEHSLEKLGIKTSEEALRIKFNRMKGPDFGRDTIDVMEHYSLLIALMSQVATIAHIYDIDPVYFLGEEPHDEQKLTERRDHLVAESRKKFVELFDKNWQQHYKTRIDYELTKSKIFSEQDEFEIGILNAPPRENTRLITCEARYTIINRCLLIARHFVEPESSDDSIFKGLDNDVILKKLVAGSLQHTKFGPHTTFLKPHHFEEISMDVQTLAYCAWFCSYIIKFMHVSNFSIEDTVKCVHALAIAIFTEVRTYHAYVLQLLERLTRGDICNWLKELAEEPLENMELLKALLTNEKEKYIYMAVTRNRVQHIRNSYLCNLNEIRESLEILSRCLTLVEATFIQNQHE